jgi:PAS domain S-box-containing protein
MSDSAPVVILLVDDDEVKRYTISRTLRRGGFELREAGTGLDALRLAREGPSLIVLDVKLPDMSGIEVCHRLKSDPTTAAIPVLQISTTFIDIEDKVLGLESGADGYLTSVEEPLELLATVKALLRARSAEEAVQLTTRQWQTTFDAISDGVFLLDRDGRVVQVNRTLESILGRPWNELVAADVHTILDLEPDTENSPYLRMRRTCERAALDLTRGDRWLQLTVDPIRDAEGVVRGGLGIISDITERKRMEDQLRHQAEDLREADQRKDEFLAMLAHELRNPLAPLLNSLEVIRLEGLGNAPLGESIETARRQVSHMARLLEDLLDVARFTRGKIHLRKEPLNLADVVAHAVETARPLIDAARHELTVTLPSGSLDAEGDATRLGQVVTNLLNNAAKYTEPGGRIILTAARDGEELVLRVRDSGVGLAPEMLPRVFNLFEQADRSLDRARGGLGIGLTMVRNLVELHGGTVSVASEGVGRGSEFVVRLPAASEPAPAPKSEVPLPHDKPSASSGLRVLVVDDLQDSARSLAKVLRLWGHEAQVVHDGPSALAAARATPFNVALLDIGLPGMDGYELAEHLRAQPESRELILVALTGYGQEADYARTRKAGFTHHLVKPVKFEQLQSILAESAVLSPKGATSKPSE